MINLKYAKVLPTFYIVLCVFVTKMWCNKYNISYCSCGLDYSMRQSRIFGGEKAKEAEFPWQAALYANNKYFCGGSIINNLYILSAAHCFKMFDGGKIMEVPPNEVSIVLGGHHLENLNKYKERKEKTDIRHILYVVLHQYFNPKRYINDISLIRLKEPLTEYSFKTLPICLPPIGQTFEDSEATVCGWGAKFSRTGAVKILRKTNVKVFKNVDCGSKLKHYFHKDVMICAASPGHDACDGDSGGPLMIKFNSFKYMQVGIVSYGIGCGNYVFPGVYSRINRYLRWIQNHTSDATYCQY